MITSIRDCCVNTANYVVDNPIRTAIGITLVVDSALLHYSVDFQPKVGWKWPGLFVFSFYSVAAVGLAALAIRQTYRTAIGVAAAFRRARPAMETAARYTVAALPAIATAYFISTRAGLALRAIGLVVALGYIGTVGQREANIQCGRLVNRVTFGVLNHIFAPLERVAQNRVGFETFKAENEREAQEAARKAAQAAPGGMIPSRAQNQDAAEDAFIDEIIRLNSDGLRASFASLAASPRDASRSYEASGSHPPKFKSEKSIGKEPED